MKYNFKFLSFIMLALVPLSLANEKQKYDDDKKEIKDSSTRGAEAWAENCGRCHNFRGAKEFAPEQWPLIMAHMRLQAQISGQTARDILDFLSGSTATAKSDSTETEKINATTPEKSESTAGTKSEVSPTSAEEARSDVNPKEIKTHTPHKSEEPEIKSSEIKAAFKNHPTKKGGSNGGDLFNKDCAVCHGKDGKGAIPGTPNFTSDASPLKTIKDENELFERTKNGYKAMPAKGGHPELSDDKIREILTYMKEKF